MKCMLHEFSNVQTLLPGLLHGGAIENRDSCLHLRIYMSYMLVGGGERVVHANACGPPRSTYAPHVHNI